MVMLSTSLGESSAVKSLREILGLAESEVTGEPDDKSSDVVAYSIIDTVKGRIFSEAKRLRSRDIIDVAHCMPLL